MGQGGVGRPAKAGKGVCAQKPVPVVPDDHVPVVPVEHDDHVPVVSAEHRTILVQGLTPQICDELLELYFENKKCGGGDIESFTRLDEEAARIVFKDDGGKMSRNA